MAAALATVGLAGALTLVGCGSTSKAPSASPTTTGQAALASPSSTSSTSSSSTGLSGKTPDQVLSLTLMAAKAEGSVHLVANNTVGGFGESVFDAGQGQGKQTVASPSGNATFLATPNMGYAQCDAAFLEHNYQMLQAEATTYAGKWISVPPSSSLYQGLVSGLTLSTLLINEAPSGTPAMELSLTKPTTINGQSVVGVSGGLGQGFSGSSFTGSEVLYVSTSAPYLPVQVVDQLNASGKTGTETDIFSNWGESVTVTAPSNAVPVSSIPTPTP